MTRQKISPRSIITIIGSRSMGGLPDSFSSKLPLAEIFLRLSPINFVCGRDFMIVEVKSFQHSVGCEHCGCGMPQETLQQINIVRQA